jgi:GNAT superfamily N-acetyltransferase
LIAPLPAGVTLHRLVDLQAAGVGRALLGTGLTRIFRATAARWPVDPTAAAAFQNLWLEQYLEHEPDLVTLALAKPRPTSEADVLGYILGCRIDPATSPRFAALSYFQEFAAQTAIWPAHLHINLDARARGQGIGAHLVEALCRRLGDEGVTGLHAVTGRDQRNVSFYTRLGFIERARAPRSTTDVLFLARTLTASR